VAYHALSFVRLRFHAANGFAPSAPPSGGLPRGENPDRFRGCWLRRSPPRPSAVAHRGPRGPYDRGAPHADACARDPPDLDADFPVAFRSMRSDLPAGLPLLGLSKDRPSIVQNQRVRLPEDASPQPPSEMDSQSIPRAARVVLHHLGGFSSPTSQVCFALLPILGFAVFPPVAKRASSQRGSALRSLPPADSDGGGTSPPPWARVTAPPFLAAPSPLALPPHPSLRAP